LTAIRPEKAMFASAGPNGPLRPTGAVPWCCRYRASQSTRGPSAIPLSAGP